MSSSCGERHAGASVRSPIFDGPHNRCLLSGRIRSGTRLRRRCFGWNLRRRRLRRARLDRRPDGRSSSTIGEASGVGDPPGSGVAVSVGLGVGVAVGFSDAPGPVTVNESDALRLTPITSPRIMCLPIAASSGISISDDARPLSAIVTVFSTWNVVPSSSYHLISTCSPGEKP